VDRDTLVLESQSCACDGANITHGLTAAALDFRKSLRIGDRARTTILSITITLSGQRRAASWLAHIELGNVLSAARAARPRPQSYSDAPK
jgi:hypothetical protein